MDFNLIYLGLCKLKNGVILYKNAHGLKEYVAPKYKGVSLSEYDLNRWISYAAEKDGITIDWIYIMNMSNIMWRHINGKLK